MSFCPSCGARVSAGENAGASDGLSFINPVQTQNDVTGFEGTSGYLPWDNKPLKCKPFTFGPYVHQYKVHGSCSHQGVKDGGELALTFTGLRFDSRKIALDLYYQSIAYMEKISANQFSITTVDGKAYEFKAVNADAWIEKISIMKN